MIRYILGFIGLADMAIGLWEHGHGSIGEATFYMAAAAVCFVLAEAAEKK